MLEAFFFNDWQGTLAMVVGGLFALAALVYIPTPLKHYAVAGWLIAAFALKIYSLGYAAAEGVADAKFNAAMVKINDENQKAVIAAETKVREANAANIATIRQQLDAQVAAAAEADAAYLSALEEISRAGKEADEATPAIILNAIRGRK